MNCLLHSLCWFPVCGENRYWESGWPGGLVGGGGVNPPSDFAGYLFSGVGVL